ncbi:hypothetical protein CFN78_09885 [Amycolatopsis antarctica]|uniref:DUF3024 domain-containing protein n=1 Tax=Amycolatopsis antarctica TaxID=1854586 RepID=A0A263D556_9PSEU|nr:DUF3024 domain-containing protein [Amycolatopsis antarctica]OZM73178.1 hypothetical protein CFN78_09885 [Amycolatopsis antarctica]
MSAVSEFQLRQIERWCDTRVPERVRDQVRVECRRRGRSVTVVERRPLGSLASSSADEQEWAEQRIAQLRLDDTDRWTLYWGDSKDRWHRVAEVAAAETPVPLLDEIDRDRHAYFWG